MSNDPLQRLRELTEKLPDLSGLTVPCGTANLVQYECGTGTCFGFCLWNNGHIAVQRAFMSNGTKFSPHVHTGHEWVVICSGHLEVTIGEDAPIDLVPGGGCYIPPGSKHVVLALADTWMIALTIPADEGYPNAG